MKVLYRQLTASHVPIDLRVEGRALSGLQSTASYIVDLFCDLIVIVNKASTTHGDN